MKRTVNRPMIPTSLPFASQKAPTSYCKRCGKLLLYCQTDENGLSNSTLEEEMSLSVCHKCYAAEMDAIQKAMIKAAEEAAKSMEPSEEEKKAADQKYEDAIKRYMEELSKNRHNTSTDI